MQNPVNRACLRNVQLQPNTFISLDRIPWSSPNDRTVFEVPAAQVRPIAVAQRLRQDGFFVAMDNDSITLWSRDQQLNRTSQESVCALTLEGRKVTVIESREQSRAIPLWG